MPDWNLLIAERLGRLALAPEMQDEVIREIAAHLEDVYQRSRSRGVSESAAVALALSQVSDWQGLGREITNAKNEEGRMNDRTRQFWLPDLATLTASMVWLMILQRWDWRPQAALVHDSPPLMPYLLWLVTQPVFGAAGAYLSYRAGGNRVARYRLLEYFLPSPCLVCSFLVGLAAALVEKNTFVLAHPYYFALIVLPWAVFPAIALLLGVFPFLRIVKNETAHSL